MYPCSMPKKNSVNNRRLRVAPTTLSPCPAAGRRGRDLGAQASRPRKVMNAQKAAYLNKCFLKYAAVGNVGARPCARPLHRVYEYVRNTNRGRPHGVAPTRRRRLRSHVSHVCGGVYQPRERVSHELYSNTILRMQHKSVAWRFFSAAAHIHAIRNAQKIHKKLRTIRGSAIIYNMCGEATLNRIHSDSNASAQAGIGTTVLPIGSRAAGAMCASRRLRTTCRFAFSHCRFIVNPKP